MKTDNLLYALTIIPLFFGCGNTTGTSGGGGSATLNLTIQNPDPNSSGASKAVAITPSASKAAAATRASLSTCTISGTGPGSVSKDFDVSPSASQISASLEIPYGSSWSICAECKDGTLTTNGIPRGYNGCTTTDINGTTTSVSLSPQFLNMIADDSDACRAIHFFQDTATQTKLIMVFGTLTDTQKSNTRVVIELDTAGTRTALGTISSSQTSGLVSHAKATPYILLTGGISMPAAFLYNTSDAKVMKLDCAWEDVSSITQAVCTFGISQMKLNIDSNEGGQFAAVCRTAAADAWDSLPNSGYGKYNLTGNSSSESDVATLVDNNNSCSTSRNGETCSSGICLSSGLCDSLSADDLGSSSATVATVAGQGAGCAPGSCSSGTTNATGTAARFNNPNGICLTPDGTTLYVTDGTNDVLRKIVVATNVVTTVSTTGSAFDSPFGCIIDSAGTNLYATNNNTNQVYKLVLATGVVSVFAGSGTSGQADHDIGTSATFAGSQGIILDPSETYLIVADPDLIRRITVGGTQSVKTMTLTDATGGFSTPSYLAIDSTGNNLYISDSANNRIKAIQITANNSSSFTGTVTTLAGSGTAGSDNGTGTAAQFWNPNGIIIDPTDTVLYTAGSQEQKIRKIVIATGVVTTVVGDTAQATDLDGAIGASTMGGPFGLALNPGGKILYISHQTFHKIRKITLP